MKFLNGLTVNIKSTDGTIVATGTVLDSWYESDGKGQVETYHLNPISGDCKQFMDSSGRVVCHVDELSLQEK